MINRLFGHRRSQRRTGKSVDARRALAAAVRGSGGAYASRPTLESLECRQLLSETILWHLNETTDTTAVDSSVNAGINDQQVDGTLQGGAAWGAGKFAGGASLDGSSGYIDQAIVPWDTVLGMTGSLAAWINTTQVGSDTTYAAPGLVGGDNVGAANDMFWGIINASGRMGIAMGNSPALNSTRAINDGLWHHVAMTRNATTGVVQLYLDGVLNGTATQEMGAKGTIAANYALGVMVDTTGLFYGYYAGSLDDVAIYDRVITALDVGKLYNPTGVAPAAPTDLTVDQVGATAVQLSWTDNSTDESGYVIERSTVGVGGPFTEVGTMGPIDAAGSFKDATAASSTTYYYRVRAFAASGTGNKYASSNVVTATTTGAAPVGTGDGLRGLYLDDGGPRSPVDPALPYEPFRLTGKLQTRVDAQVNFNWGGGSPMRGMGGDNFSVRWVGQIEPLYSENYTFYTATDDGARLYIDGNLAIDDLTYHNMATERSSETSVPGGIALVGGQKYDIVMEMYENDGDAGAILRWSSFSTAKGVVPQTQLYTTAQSAKPSAVTGVTATPGWDYDGTMIDTYNTVTVSWTDPNAVANVIGYKIMRSATAGGTYAEVMRVGGSSYVDTSVAPGKSYYYKVIAYNLAGDAPTSAASAAANTTALPVQAGLLGTYFDNRFLQGPRRFVRVDADVAWTGASTASVRQFGVINWPDPNPADPVAPAVPIADSPLGTGITWIDDSIQIGVAWEGTFTPTATGVHTFYVRNDDAMRLFVNGQLLTAVPADFGGGHGAQGAPGDAGTITLTVGVAVPIVVLYNQGSGVARAELRWKGPGASDPIAILTVDGVEGGPTHVLSSTVTAPAAPVLSATKGSVTVNLAWSDTALNEYLDRVEMSSDSGATWITLTNIFGVSNVGGAAGTGSYFVSALLPSTDYSFRVTEVNSAGEAVSNVLALKTNAPVAPNVIPAPAPATTDLTVEGKLDWNHYGLGGDSLAWNAITASLISSITVENSDGAFAGTNGVLAQRENDLGGTVVPFGEDVFCYLDRNHEYNGAAFNATTLLPSTTGTVIRGLPSYLIGGEYVSTLNGNRDNATFRMHTRLGKFPVTAYLLVDNRVGPSGKSNTVPPAMSDTMMAWVARDGWTMMSTDVSPNLPDGSKQPDFGGFDEIGTPANFGARTHVGNTVGAGVGLNQFFTIYSKQFPAGAMIDTYEQNSGGINMYGLVLQMRPGNNLTMIGSGTVVADDTEGTTFSWSNGKPTVASPVGGTDDAIAVAGTGNGFRFTVAAQNYNRQLKVYVAVDGTAQGTFSTSVSDLSILPYSDVLTAAGSLKTQVYTINFQAENANQTMTVNWVNTGGSGQIYMMASSLFEAAPTVPSNLVADPIAGGGSRITFQDNSSNELGFIVQRKTASTDWAQVASLGPNVIAWNDTSLALVPNTEYFYRVCAFNTAGNSDFTNIDGAVQDVPLAPRVFVGPDDKLLTVYWTPVRGADKYVVQKATLATGPWTVLNDNVTATQLADTAVNNRTRYYYKVTAYKMGFAGAESAVVSGMPSLVVEYLKVNFTYDGSDPNNANLNGEEVLGYSRDDGHEFGYTSYTVGANTYYYGWRGPLDEDVDGVLDPTPNTNSARNRNSANTPGPDERLDSFNHMQRTANIPQPDGSTLAVVQPNTWDIELPPGDYRVFIVAGDPDNEDSYFAINAEGTLAVLGEPVTGNRYISGLLDSGYFVDVKVADGSLTITSNLVEQAAFSAATGQTGGHAANNKICYIDIYKLVTTATLPAAPSDLLAEALPGGAVTLTWTDNANNELGYVIERKAPGGAYQQIGPVLPANSTTYTDSDGALAPNVEYSYRVRATNVAGNSSPSNVATATVLMHAPPDFAGVGRDGGVELTWTAWGGAFTYTLTRTTFDSLLGEVVPGSDIEVVTGLAAGTHFDSNGTTAGTDYYYTLVADDGVEASQPLTILVTAMQGEKFARVNFTIPAGEDYTGYVKDVGLLYGPQNAMEYGWVVTDGPAGTDNTGYARDRQETGSEADIAAGSDAPFAIDERYDSLNHMQRRSLNGTSWEIAVPNGTYSIHVAGGDPENADDNIGYLFEGGTANQVATGITPIRKVVGEATGDDDPNTVQWRFAEHYVTVVVTDGKLTVQTDAISPRPDPDANNDLQTVTGGYNNKICYIDINQVSVITELPLVVNGTPNADIFYVKREGDNVVVYDNLTATGTPIVNQALNMITTFTINSGDGNDQVIVDFVNGNPFGALGLSLNDTVGSDVLTVKGTNGAEAVTASDTQVLFGTGAISLAGIDKVVLEQIKGAVEAKGAANVEFNATATLASLKLSDTAAVALTAGGDKVMKVAALTIGAGTSLDLNDGDMIVTADAATRAAVYASVFNAIKSGRAGGTWAGKGLTSTTAKNQDPLKKYAGLASMINDKGIEGAWYVKFDGIAVSVNDILVKYSWNGDANLDGVANIDDYFRIDAGFITQVGGFQNGDFNYDGVTNIDDYFLIDSAFLGQTGKLAADEATEDVVVQQAAKKQDEPSVLSQLFSDVPVL